MSKFVDVYLLPIAQDKVPEYKKLAQKAGRVFVRNGALRYREYVAADLKAEGVMAFPAVVKLNPGETIIYAAVEFKSEAHRNKTMAKVFKDPELEAIAPKESPFDYKRMVYGGFSIIVDL